MRYIAAGVTLLAFAGCASQPVQVDSVHAAQAAGAKAPVQTVATVPVAPAPVTRTEGAALTTALSTDNRAEAASLSASAAGLPNDGADKQAADLAKARKLGYRIVDQNGQPVYCHDSTATGSHLHKETICLTQAQWDNVSENASRAMQKMQGVTFPCPTSAKNGGCGS
jgi:hypothetical protein